MKHANVPDNSSAFDRGRDYGHDAGSRRPYGIAIGIAMSLLLHTLILYGVHLRPSPALAPAPGSPVQSLTVWLAPPAPVRAPAEAVPAAPPLAARPAEKPQATAHRDPRALPAQPSDRTPGRTTTAVIVLPSKKEGGTTAPNPGNATDDPFAEKAPAPTKPGFDIEAAHRVARQVATERDPAKVGTAVGQIPDKPLPDETSLARNIDSAKRRDCKDGVPGGLLAPLLLMMDKKDSGCKW